MSKRNEVMAWGDEAMFRAEAIDRSEGPRAFLLSCNPDPLGSIAACAKAYIGEFVEDLSQITDDERRYYLQEVQKSVLVMPLEAVQLHFRITGVTRGFTHQMVRQRTAAYAQESTRFAVKDTVPVGDPPSIQGVKSRAVRAAEITFKNPHMTAQEALSLAAPDTSEEKWRDTWDHAVELISHAYNSMIDTGMPAEDARGILPTNLLTQINYVTNLRGLKEHAGLRLCTQAQFEWRQVWGQMISAIRDYGQNQLYQAAGEWVSSDWQFREIANIFRPICYYRGRCQFESEMDRKCTIRDRVNSFADLGIPSTKWDQQKVGEIVVTPISPAEWLLDPAAAR